MPFMEYMSDIERDMDIIFREHEIAIEKCETTFLLESMNYMIEGEEEPTQNADSNTPNNTSSNFKSKTMNFINSVIEKIKRLINDIGEMFKNIGSKDAEMTVEDFFNSQTGDVTYKCDMKQMQRVIDNEMAEGRKFVNMIAKGIKVEPATVAKWVDFIPSKLNKCNGEALLDAATAKASINIMSKNRAKYKDDMEKLKNVAMNKSGNEDVLSRLSSGFQMLINKSLHSASDVMQFCGVYSKADAKIKKQQAKDARKNR